MKKINYSLLIGIIAFASCKKEQSPTMPAANRISQSNISAVSGACKTLPAELIKHLVAYYPFCGNANDESGNGNNASFINATLTTDRFGNANSAYSFNGNGQYIKGDCSKYPKKCRTVSLWFKINEADLVRHNEIMGYGGIYCGTSFFTMLNEGGGDYPNDYMCQDHCRNNLCVTGKGYPPDPKWNNWIITSGNNITRFYLNGVLLKTFNNVDFDETYVKGKDFVFGSMVYTDGTAPYSDINHDFLKGFLDDIVIYNWVLSPTQVKQLYDFFK